MNKFIFRASKGDDVIKNFEAGPDASKDVVFEFGSDGTLTVLNVPLSKIKRDLLAIRAAFDLHKNHQKLTNPHAIGIFAVPGQEHAP